jgi:hypothetical protein
MRRVIPLVLALMLVTAACNSGNDSTTDETANSEATTTSAGTATTVAPGTTTTEALPGEVSPLVIAAVDFEAGIIVIRNEGSEDYDLTGHWICNRPNYSELPSGILAPGETIEIDTAVIELSSSDGEVALYSSNSFGSADDILRYVQWGSDSHGRTATAVAGGVWQDGDFVDNQARNIESTGSNPVAAADWSSN